MVARVLSHGLTPDPGHNSPASSRPHLTWVNKQMNISPQLTSPSHLHSPAQAGPGCWGLEADLKSKAAS